MPNALASDQEVEEVEILKALPTGTRVRLPDGDEGIVNWSSHAEVHVVHPGRVLGRGPWIFHRSQVEVAA